MTGLVSIIEPAIIGDLKSYWAMHFCSVLETLYEHKQLEFNIQKAISLSEPRTLSSFVGVSERGFFSRIRENVRNWGLQYFLCHYLMSSEGWGAFKLLVDNISNNYDFDVLRNYAHYGVYVCGIDSYSGEAFLNTCNAAILGYDNNTINNVWRDIKYVDLCVLIRRHAGDLTDTALLGEVEGNKGYKTLQPGYWEYKSRACLFGIGVKEGEQNATIQNVRFESCVKTIIMLGSEFSVIKDFQAAVGTMETFLSLRPQHHVISFPGLDEVIDRIRVNWSNPIEVLIDELRSFIYRVDSAVLGTNPLSIPSVPKLIVGPDGING
jgi:hypothetical protein